MQVKHRNAALLLKYGKEQGGRLFFIYVFLCFVIALNFNGACTLSTNKATGSEVSVLFNLSKC